ncbi:NADH dehydrogenase [ubiquinone] iron-sulfur protein 4, mitochondrial-like [Onthophagus taurus]|uniref:NADH dehydrogenase [ubiquinone] iron-sulfur protein 4, mitochondrial-like n=1 Tax=Onthophagus taurus TaxID=166361 RepID=UPI0039BEA45E
MRNFQHSIREVKCPCPPKKKLDPIEDALYRNEAPIIPLQEFFETEEEKERDLKCKHTHFSDEKGVDMTHVNVIPKEYTNTRTARIYKETRHCMQNGNDNVKYWHVQFDTTMRFENSLIGWCSSSDALSNMKLHFHSLAAAQEFCHRNGFDYYVDVPPRKDFVVKSYSDNFSWNKRRRVTTK